MWNLRLLFCGLAMISTFASAQTYYWVQGTILGPNCNCPPENAESVPVEAQIPSGRTFTGDCDEVLGVCKTVEYGHYGLGGLITIPPLHCLIEIEAKIVYNDPVLIGCDEDSDCPSGVNVTASFVEWVERYKPCWQEDDPEDHGVEA